MQRRKILPALGLTLGLLLQGGLASAHEHAKQAAGITVQQPWARATVTGQPSGGGFFTLVNQGKEDKLLSVSADVSDTVELHTMEMKDQVMRMREVDGVAVPANGKVALQPGGFHVMFMKLKAPLKAGTRFPATLKFQHAGDVKIEFKVAPVNHKPSGGSHGHAH